MLKALGAVVEVAREDFEVAGERMTVRVERVAGGLVVSVADRRILLEGPSAELVAQQLENLAAARQLEHDVEDTVLASVVLLAQDRLSLSDSTRPAEGSAGSC